MEVNSFKELAKKMKEKMQMQNKCNHDFGDKSVGIGCSERIGGKTFEIFRCKKCGYTYTK